MSILVNSHSAISPPGSIIPYIGGGTTVNGVNSGDPDGWVICDGVNRTSTDNRFINVYTILNTYMGVTTNNANSITPPNLTSSFIYGQASAATLTQSTGGASSIALTVNNIPSHDIAVTATDSGHTHGDLNTNIVSGGQLTGSSGYTFGTVYTGTRPTISTSSANITASGSFTNNNLQNVPTIPPYVSMNYIIKY